MGKVKFLLKTFRKLLEQLKVINCELPNEIKSLRSADTGSFKTTYKEKRCSLAVTFELSIIPKFIVKFTRDCFSKAK
jgi:hypothetical protein